MGLHEAVDAIERVGGDAAAVAQPRRELAVVDGAAAERGFGQPGAAAIVGDLLKQLLRVHGTRPGRFPSAAARAQSCAVARFGRGWPRSSEPSDGRPVNHKLAHSHSGQDNGR
jgi:hypothetical protein